jgi:MFS family permease
VPIAGGFFRGLPRPFVVLWWGTLINRLGGFVVPFLAIYLTQARGYSIAQVGFIASLYGAGSLLAGPLGGTLADRVGRRATMLAALCVGAAAVLVLGFCSGSFMVAAAVFCVAFFGSMYSPAASAMVADIVVPADRQRAYGLLYWAVNLGFSAAMAVAGLLVEHGYLVLFIADAATTFLFALLVFFHVPESKPVGAKPKTASFAAPFADTRFLAFFLLMLGIALIYNQAHCTLPVDMQRHGISAARYGYLLGLNGILVAVLQPLVGRRILAAAPAKVLAAAAVLTGLGFGMCAFASSFTLYAASIVIWTLGEILGAPAGPSVVADLAPASLRGTYQGALQMAWGGGSFVAPLAGALIMGSLGGAALWLACLLLGVLVAVGHLLVTAKIVVDHRHLS